MESWLASLFILSFCEFYKRQFRCFQVSRPKTRERKKGLLKAANEKLERYIVSRPVKAEKAGHTIHYKVSNQNVILTRYLHIW